jgi:hypothetical protein
LGLLDLPLAADCNCDKIAEFAVRTRDRGLVQKLGNKILPEFVKQVIDDACNTSLSREKRNEHLDFAAFLFNCRAEPRCDDLLNWAKNIENEDVLLFLYDQAMKLRPIGWANFDRLVALCTRLKNPGLLVSLIDLAPSVICLYQIMSFAVRTRDRGLVQKLLNKGCQLPLNLTNDKGHTVTPLTFIIQEACKPIHSGDIRRSWREFAIFVLGKAPVDLAELIELMKVARSANDLEVGRILYGLDANGLLNNAMRDAVDNERFESLRFLLELHVNLNIHFPDGFTPLTLAAASGNLRAVQWLLADPRLNRNLPCKYFFHRGKTALEIAVRRGFEEIASLLQPGWKRKPEPSEYEFPKSFVPPHVPSVLKIPYFPRDLFPLDLCRRAGEVESAKVKTTLFEKSRLAEFLSQIALGSKTPPYWGIFGVTEDAAVKMGSEEFNKITRKLLPNIHHDKNRALEGEDKSFCEQIYKAVFEVRQKLLDALQELEKVAK